MENSEVEAKILESEIDVSASDDFSEDFTDGIGEKSDSAEMVDKQPCEVKIAEFGQLKSANVCKEVLNEDIEMKATRSDVEVKSVEKDVMVVDKVKIDGVTADPIPCFYCDDMSFDVKDIESYKTHLGEVHSVKKNLDVLAELTIKTQHGGDGHLDCVSPEPLVSKEPVFIMPENLSDFDSDDDDDMFGSSKDDENIDTELKEELDINTADIPEDADDTLKVEKLAEEEPIGNEKDKCQTANEDIEQNTEAKVKVEESSKEETPSKDVAKCTPEESEVNNENDDKDEDQDTLTLEIEKQDEFDMPPEDEENDKKDDALSDLSLSDDDFDQSNADWVVLDEANSEDKENKVDELKTEPSEDSETCFKCDTAHKIGGRCSFILRNSKPPNNPSRTLKRGRGEYSGGRPREPEYRQPREKVRTLPPELYNNPNDYERRSYRRSRSPRRRPPTPPFEREGYEDRRDRRPRDDEDRRLYEKKYDDLYASYDRSEEKGERKSCKLCSSTAHLVKNCPDLFCYKCDRQGHFAKECSNPSKKDKPHSNNYTNTQHNAYTQPSYNYPHTQQIPPQSINQTPSMQMSHPPPSVPYASSTFGTSSSYPVPPSAAPPVTDHLPSNYAESLHSLQPLQLFMSAKMMSMPGQSYPKTYIDLLVTNVGKMLAQANLGLQALLTAFSTKGEAFVRALISKELSVYAERFPGGVNMPLITHTTIEYLITQGGAIQHYPYPAL